MVQRATVLVLVFVLCIAAASVVSCNDDGGDDSALGGADLYLVKGCNNCHGPEGAGLKGFAPTLHGKRSFWTRESLLAYFKDPQTFRQKDPRLKAQGAPYTLAMPTYKMEPPAVLEKLADHVLSMP